MSLLPVECRFDVHVGVEQGVVEFRALLAGKHSQPSQPAEYLWPPSQFSGHVLKGLERDGDHAVFVL